MSIKFKSILFATLLLSVAWASLLKASHLKQNKEVDPQVKQLDLTCGFTQDFGTFLKDNNYELWGFDRTDINCAAFGGKQHKEDSIAKTPIIFIHGNSDIGFGDGKSGASWQTGFRQLAIFFGSQGYNKAELYTTTWGLASIEEASMTYHSKNYILMMRAFVQAVLAYTQAPYVNIISHSMGVTIARKVAQGGTAEDHRFGTYNVGPSLKGKIKNFIGIAGGNLGLTACFEQEYIIPTCGHIDGFFPGNRPLSSPSKFLGALNANPGGEAENVFSIWSKFDTVIGGQCVVWGKVTCRFPGQKAEVVKKSIEWSHLALRDKTGPDILALIKL